MREGKPTDSVDCYHCVQTMGLHNQLWFPKSEAISAGCKKALQWRNHLKETKCVTEKRSRKKKVVRESFHCNNETLQTYFIIKTTVALNSDITSGLKGNVTLEELGGDPVLHRLPRQQAMHVRVLTPSIVTVPHVGVAGQ